MVIRPERDRSPPRRVDPLPLIRDVDRELIRLLGGLEPPDWAAPAVGDWTVRDVAAHLLDGNLRRLAFDRDGFTPPAPDGGLEGFDDIVGFLNRLNAEWVAAARRLSPRVLIDLLETTGEEVRAYMGTVDPDAPAAFPVAWAGEEASRAWFDFAREFTEKWHHQQQIREAVGAEPLTAPRYLRPLLRVLVHGVPRSYRGVPAAAGATVRTSITDAEGLEWTLVREEEGWTLHECDAEEVGDAALRLGSETAWRLWMGWHSGEEARRETSADGPAHLTDPFFRTRSVMI